MARYAPLFGAAVLLFSSVPISGHAALSALKGHNTHAPVDIEAQRFEVRDKEKTTLFSGFVKVTQGDLKLATNSARVFYDRTKDKLTVRRVDAQGAVRMSSPSETVDAAWGIYDVETEALTLGGNVTLTRGKNEVHGQRLEMNLKTGITTLDGNDPSSTGSASSGGRVKATFSVPERTKKL